MSLISGGRGVSSNLFLYMYVDSFHSFQDDSDAQYRSFRNNIPVLCALIIAFLGLKRIYLYLYKRIAEPNTSNQLCSVPFVLCFSGVMLIGLHGSSVIKIAIIFVLNYTVAHVCKGSLLNPLLTWMFNAAVLFSNEWNAGYRF